MGEYLHNGLVFCNYTIWYFMCKCQLKGITGRIMYQWIYKINRHPGRV